MKIIDGTFLLLYLEIVHTTVYEIAFGTVYHYYYLYIYYLLSEYKNAPVESFMVCCSGGNIMKIPQAESFSQTCEGECTVLLATKERGVVSEKANQRIIEPRTL